MRDRAEAGGKTAAGSSLETTRDTAVLPEQATPLRSTWGGSKTANPALSPELFRPNERPEPLYELCTYQYHRVAAVTTCQPARPGRAKRECRRRGALGP